MDELTKTKGVRANGSAMCAFLLPLPSREGAILGLSATLECSIAWRLTLRIPALLKLVQIGPIPILPDL